MGGADGNDPFEDLHAYARDLQNKAGDLPPSRVRPAGARRTRGATYASRTPHLVVAVAVAFLLVAGGAGTGILADGAVPGDALYSIDLLLEDAWSAIGLPLDTEAERREEAQTVAQRDGTLVALPEFPADRPGVDAESIGADAAARLRELQDSLAPPAVADDSDPAEAEAVQPPEAAEVVLPPVDVPEPAPDLAEPPTAPVVAAPAKTETTESSPEPPAQLEVLATRPHRRPTATMRQAQKPRMKRLPRPTRNRPHRTAPTATTRPAMRRPPTPAMSPERTGKEHGPSKRTSRATPRRTTAPR